MEAQGHVRVLRGIGPRVVEGDLVEGDLLRPLARHLLVLAGPDPEVAGRQGVHVVPGRGAVEHVGGEHRVVRDPGHRDAVVREHAHVVLEVVADLAPVRILEEGAQRAQHPALVELVRSAGIAVRERHVRPFTGRDRESDSDHPRVHVVEAGGFGVEGEGLGGGDPVHPPVEGLLGQHRLVRRLGLGRGRRAALGSRLPALARFVARPFEKLAQERTELEPAVQHLEGATVRGAGAKLVGRFRELDVAPDRDETPRELHLAFRRAVRREERAQVLADLPPDRRRVVPDPIERAVGGEPLDGRLRSDLGDPRHVVHRVPDEGEVVDHVPGGDSEPCLDPCFVQDGIVHGVDEDHLTVHELGHVLVVGRDEHPAPAVAGALGEGADDVVRLDPGNAEKGQPLGGDDLVERLDLHAKLVRHGRAVRLVLGIPVVPEGLAGRVEDDREVLARVVGPEPAEHVEDPEDRAGRLPIGVGEGRHGVEGPEEIRRAVHEYDGG